MFEVEQLNQTSLYVWFDCVIISGIILVHYKQRYILKYIDTFDANFSYATKIIHMYTTATPALTHARTYTTHVHAFADVRIIDNH